MKCQTGHHPCLSKSSTQWRAGDSSMGTILLLFLLSLASIPCFARENSWVSCPRIFLCAPRDRQVLISLGLTKSGKRQGAAESVILGIEAGIALVRQWKHVAHTTTPLVLSPVRWRSLFSECLTALGLDRFQYRPYSLRRGGATWWFQKHQNLDRIWCRGDGWPRKLHVFTSMRV